VFVWLYALAWGGGVVAYAPFLTLVLPLRVEALAPDVKVALLSLIALVGALVASVVNILVGVLSDRSVGSVRGRRPWVALGLGLTLASYALLPFCSTPMTLLAGVILFQVALNTMLGPLGAIAADETPDSQKGFISGAMGAGGALGVVAGVIVTAWPRAGLGTQLTIITGLVLICVLPFLVICRRRGPLITVPEQGPVMVKRRRQDLARAWIARLLIQVCGGVLFAYLIFYLQTVDRTGVVMRPGDIAGQAAWLSGAASIALIPLAVAVGRLSDRSGVRRPFLVGAAALVAVGLVVMAFSHHWAAAFFGYLVFSFGVGLFLTLQNAYAMQLLANSGRRGRDMGILNLTNTLPAMVATGLAWGFARSGDFSQVLLILAALAVVAATLMARVRDQNLLATDDDSAG